MYDFGPNPPVIGLTGPGGIGKSTVAQAIREVVFMLRPATELDPTIIHIGQPLKDMLEVLLRAAGLNDNDVHYWVYGDGKRRPCPVFGGKTPTHAMQTLGTEWGREAITGDLWLSIWKEKARNHQSQGGLVINDSVRFQNEVDAIHDLGGYVFNLTGRKGDLSPTHKSETPVNGDFDVVNAPGKSKAAAEAILAALYVDPDVLVRHG